MAQRILIIDDEPLLADLIAQAFRDDGFDTDTAYGGEAGLRLFETRRHPLVVADVVMPGCDGLDLIRAIRRIDRRARIVAISGGGAMDSQLLLNAAAALGADAAMQKPFLPSALVDLAAGLLGSGIRVA